MYQSYYMPYGFNIPPMSYGVPLRGAMPGISGMRGFGGIPNLGRSAAGLSGGLGRSLGGAGASRGLGLLGRLRGGASFFRNINWGSLFNNASRALGAVNQAIPLVKQAGPMMSNMKSMLRVASIFKDETDPAPRHHRKKNTSYNNNVNTTINNDNTVDSHITSNITNNMDINSNLSNDNEYAPHFFVS